MENFTEASATEALDLFKVVLIPSKTKKKKEERKKRKRKENDGPNFNEGSVALAKALNSANKEILITN